MNIDIPDKNSFHSAELGTGLFILKNKHITAAVTNYGARWVSMIIPDKNGILTDVVTGFDSLNGFIHSTEAYYGATVGRYANRIAKGKFELEGNTYTLATNIPPNHLHGGIIGFHAMVWEVLKAEENFLELVYFSKDMEEGYPGNLSVRVTYLLTDEDEMKINFEATTDCTTVVNLTNHAYFNLNGQGSGNIYDHRLTINADHFTPVDETSIPYGTYAEVRDTPFDFRGGKLIGADIEQDHQQIKYGSGYDHNFVLNKTTGELSFAAEAVGDRSGIKMQVFTTEPGLQLYTGNFMAGNNLLKGGLMDQRRYAFCLETQHYPDSPNKPGFPSTVLHSRETYESVSIFRFSNH